MGRLIEGKWHDVWYDTEKHGGRFVREHAGYREWVRADGSTPFRPAKGRYHLYVSWACPWAHRTLILRRLKKLEDVIDVSVVHWFMRKDGWTFRQEDGDTGDATAPIDPTTTATNDKEIFILYRVNSTNWTVVRV